MILFLINNFLYFDINVNLIIKINIKTQFLYPIHNLMQIKLKINSLSVIKKSQ